MYLKKTEMFHYGARSHMTSIVIEKSQKAKIVVMAFPAHTSTRVQTLDVSIFGTFKHHNVKLLQAISDGMKRPLSGA